MNTTVDIVLPVYNEEKDLPRSVMTLRQFLKDNFSRKWRIVIADNGSTDQTLTIAEALATQYPGVAYVHLPEKGRGRALRRAWLESNADVVSYMDVDLSTNLNAFPRAVSAIVDQGYDIAIGSRLTRGARVMRRPLKREVASRCYNMLIKAFFFTRFSDAQCGFKAISRRAAQELVPLVKDQAWFFDSELLILAEKMGYRIKDIPVEWTDDPDSRVKIVKTATEDVKGLLRLRFGGLREARRVLATGRSPSGDGIG